MYTNRHLQLTGFFNQRFYTRVINVNILTVSRTRIRIAFALVAKFTNTDCAQFLTALQGFDATLGPALFANTRVIKAAPETEMLLVRRISFYVLLKRTTNPTAMHDSCVQHAYFIHRRCPSGNLFFRTRIVVRMHVDDVKLRALNLCTRQIVHYYRTKILQQNLVCRILRVSRLLAADC